PCGAGRGTEEAAAGDGAAGDVAGPRALLGGVVAGLRQAHPDLRFAAGMSACCPLVGDLRQAASQAASALASLADLPAGEAVALFDDLGGVRFLLTPADRNQGPGDARSRRA